MNLPAAEPQRVCRRVCRKACRWRVTIMTLRTMTLRRRHGRHHGKALRRFEDESHDRSSGELHGVILATMLYWRVLWNCMKPKCYIRKGSSPFEDRWKPTNKSTIHYMLH